MTELIFNGKKYPAREIIVDGTRKVISTEALYEKLMNDKCEPVSSRADEIEKMVFFFVPDDVMAKTDTELVSYMTKEQPEYNIEAVN